VPPGLLSAHPSYVNSKEGILMALIPNVRTSPLLVALLTCVACSVAGPAMGASQRTFVASYGSDGSPNCALLAPCRSFNAAIAQTSGGGEVVILDTAGYGPMVINKSIKVIGPAGVYGGISVIGGANPTTGIVINAGDNDDVILRGLDITGVPGSAPLPLIGIDIQNAGAVHIEKSSISNFPEDGGSCLQVVTAKSVRVYVDDSFLRHCLTGIYANGNVVSASRSALIIDNTRIERGFNANPASLSIGLWMQGFFAVSLRNSVISRNAFGVKIDANLAGASGALDIIDSLLTQNTNGVYFSGTAGGSSTLLKVTGSQLTSLTNDAFNLSNSAIGRNVILTVSGTRIHGTANAVTLQNSAADANTRMYVEMDSSQAVNVANAIDTNSTNGAKTYAVVRDSTLAHVNAAIKTRGTFGSVSLIRSQVNNCTIAVDHGTGVVRLDDSHVVKCADDFVNNGSGNIVSTGRNMVHDIDNLSGFVYIPPMIIPLK